MKKGTRIGVIVLAVLILLLIAVYIVFHHYASMLNYVPLEGKPTGGASGFFATVYAEDADENTGNSDAFGVVSSFDRDERIARLQKKAEDRILTGCFTPVGTKAADAASSDENAKADGMAEEIIAEDTDALKENGTFIMGEPVSEESEPVSEMTETAETEVDTATDPAEEFEEGPVQEELLEALNADETEENYDYASKDLINILLVGADNDDAMAMDQLGNADGLIIVSINRTDKRIVLSSLMRDVYAPFPDDENGLGARLTLAYHQGGMKLLVDVIEYNFRIPIHNYVLINYLDLIQIVDALGGLELEVTEEEIFFMQEKIENLNLMLGLPRTENVLQREDAGLLNLNGVQTAAFMRIRYAGNGDFDRTERARRVIATGMEKLKSMRFRDYDRLARTLLPCITTDFDGRDLISLLLNGQKYMAYEQVSVRIPIEGEYLYDRTGRIIIDFPANCAFLYEMICGKIG